MKKAIITLLLISFSIGAFAQRKESKKGYWVVESNIKTPKKSTVKFYNQQNEVIYQETIVDRRVNIERAKVKKALNRVLVAVQNNEHTLSTANLLIKELEK